MRSKTIGLFLALGLAATLVACNQGGETEGGEVETTTPPATESPIESPTESPEESPTESPEESPTESPAEGGEGGEGGEGN